MSKEFIQKPIGVADLEMAKRQQNQLLFYSRSEIQDNYSNNYWDRFTDKDFNSDDHFLMWVCQTFKKSNFKKLAKNLRYPLATSRLIDSKIIPELSRINYSEDSYVHYQIGKESFTTQNFLDSQTFSEELFEALIYKPNDFIVHDYQDKSKPFRYILDINYVVSLESCKSVISKIAFRGKIDGQENEGYIYIDDKEYTFYDKEFKNAPITVIHDIGVCPVVYVSPKPFGDKDIVRSALLGNVRELMETYLLYHTLQKMTEHRGSIPVTTSLAVTEVKESKSPNKNTIGDLSSDAMSSTRFTNGIVDSEPMSDKRLEAGTNTEVPLIKKSDGGIDMDVVKNFINFFYLPVEAMEYVDKRVNDLKNEIIVTVIGDYVEHKQAVNQLQVSKSLVSRQDILRQFASTKAKTTKRSDTIMLSIKYGSKNILVENFGGSDFFLESETELYDLLVKAPNPIESKNVLTRLSNNRNRFNKTKGDRDKILYELLPYATNTDFDKAIAKNAIDPVIFEYQTRFNYWISKFESTYGDITNIYINMGDASMSEKTDTVNKMILELIVKSEYNGTKRENESTESANSSSEML